MKKKTFSLTTQSAVSGELIQFLLVGKIFRNEFSYLYFSHRFMRGVIERTHRHYLEDNGFMASWKCGL